MKTRKAKSAIFAFMAAALAAVLCVMFGATGAVARAESGQSARQGENFIYSAEFTSEADFRDDFAAAAGWEYGYTENYDFGADTFTFNPLTDRSEEGALKDDTGKIILKKDWFQTERDGAITVVRYTIEEAGEIRIAASFNGTNEETRISGRVNIAAPDGSVQLCDFIYDGTNVWMYNKTVNVEKGSKISLLFSKESDAWRQGSFDFTISLPVNAGFTFGEREEDPGFAVTAKDGKIGLYQKGESVKELKTAAFPVAAGEKFELTLIVNEGVAKIYPEGGNVAVLICKLDGYTGGAVRAVSAGGVKIKNESFIRTDTPDGHIFVGGYTVKKVVNLTDGNYKLNADEYTAEKGVVTVSESYLKSLEAGKEYRFRVVTSFTDFDFNVSTDFFADVTVTPSVDKYYKDGDITLELGGSVTVEKLLIDGKELSKDDYTQDGGKIIISARAAGELATGKHTVKLYTNKGRPEVAINVSEKVETVTEPEEKSNHVFLWVDLAIFGSAILGYAAYSVIKKVRKK